MRNIWTIFKTDIRTLSRCFFACVVVLAIIEAMKMETAITARTAGTVQAIRIKEGQPVKARELLVTLA